MHDSTQTFRTNYTRVGDIAAEYAVAVEGASDALENALAADGWTVADPWEPGARIFERAGAATGAERLILRVAGVDSADRADLVTARQTVRLAADGGDYADLNAAALLIDRVLARSCPHDPETHIIGDDNGRQLVTCPACGVSWYLA